MQKKYLQEIGRSGQNYHFVKSGDLTPFSPNQLGKFDSKNPRILLGKFLYKNLIKLLNYIT